MGGSGSRTRHLHRRIVRPSSSFRYNSNANAIASAQTGQTVEGKQDFTSFLGPMYGELVEKFRKWILLTDCACCVSRATPTIDMFHTAHEDRQTEARTSPQPFGTPEPSLVAPTPTQPGLTPSPPGTPSIVVSKPTVQPSSPATPSSTATPMTPVGPIIATSDSTTTDLDTFDMDFNAIDSPAMTDSEVAPANVVISTTTNSVVADPTTTNSVVADLNATIPTATDPGINGPSVVSPTTTDPGVVVPTTTGPVPAGTASANTNVSGPTVADSGQHSSIGVTIRAPSSVHHSPPGQGTPDRVESPAETAYPKFAALEVFVHLSSIPNVDGWSNLVQAYLKFEAASPSKNVSFRYSVLFYEL